MADTKIALSCRKSSAPAIVHFISGPYVAHTQTKYEIRRGRQRGFHVHQLVEDRVAGCL